MALRTWWAVLGPAALVAGIALLRGDHGEDLEIVAVLLALSALGHAVRPDARRGTPTQNLTQVLLVAFAAGAAAALAFLALLLVVFSAVCGTSCDGRGPSAGPAVVGLVILAVALGVVVAALRAWRAVERRRTTPAATPRPLLLAPAAAVALVLGGLALAASADDRPRPAVAPRLVATTPCAPLSSSAPCVQALRLAAAGSGRGVLAVWRQGDRIEGVLNGPDVPARRVTVATGLPRAVRDEDGSTTAVAPAPDGGFVVAWAVGGGPRLGVRRVDADGVPGRAAALPSPGRRPVLGLASTRDGTVVVAAERPEVPNATTRVRTLALDARLRPRGGWRTVATGGAVAPLRAAATGGDRVAVSRGPWNPELRLDATGRVPADGRRSLPAPRPPRPDGVPAARRPPSLVDSTWSSAGRVLHLWSTKVPRGGGDTGLVEQSWITGDGPARLVAENLDEARLAATTDGPAAVGVRERDGARAAGDAGRTADVLLAWGR
ncbi:hypothetical protein [Patulibacter americanus]|uniref:hypothetical protein n=1 Tax=Patulibacter americanus TaxID=588672 RepID=UPI0003B3CA23|nr:hypothetical protein [Patulibacter americanus]